MHILAALSVVKTRAFGKWMTTLRCSCYFMSKNASDAQSAFQRCPVQAKDAGDHSSLLLLLCTR